MSFRISLVAALFLLITPAMAQSIEEARQAYRDGNYGRAHEVSLILSNQGDALGQNLMGVLYENGHGVEADIPRAIAYYEAAIAQGEVRAMANLGDLYSRGTPDFEPQPALAQDLLERAVDLGNVGAINSLGVFFEQGGQSDTPDYARAIELYRRAMDLGDLDAAANLGGLYYDGLWVEQDYALARSHFALSAEGGLARGMNGLAAMLEFGNGGPANVPLALQWYERAADAGHTRSLYALADINFNGATGVPANIPRALEYYERAHAMGDADAAFALGWIYEGGHGVSADPQRAVGYLQAALDGGSSGASILLAYLYQEGNVVPADHVYARMLMTQAAHGGEVDAFDELGVMLSNGVGGLLDLPGAESYFRAGYQHGDLNAGVNLARLLNNPDHPRYNPAEGYAYCLWALERGGPEAPEIHTESCALIADGLSELQLSEARRFLENL